MRHEVSLIIKNPKSPYPLMITSSILTCKSPWLQTAIRHHKDELLLSFITIWPFVHVSNFAPKYTTEIIVCIPSLQTNMLYWQNRLAWIYTASISLFHFNKRCCQLGRAHRLSIWLKTLLKYIVYSCKINTHVEESKYWL